MVRAELLEKGVPIRYCSPVILKFSIECCVARAGTLHLVTVPVDSAGLGVHRYPHTLIWFFDGSPTKEVRRPACDIETEQPPAKEQETAESRAVTVGEFAKVAVDENNAHCYLELAFSWK